MEALRGWEPAQGQTAPGGFHPSSEGSTIRKRREQGLANQSEPAPHAACSTKEVLLEHSASPHGVATLTPQWHISAAATETRLSTSPQDLLTEKLPADTMAMFGSRTPRDGKGGCAHLQQSGILMAPTPIERLPNRVPPGMAQKRDFPLLGRPRCLGLYKVVSSTHASKRLSNSSSSGQDRVPGKGTT